MTSTLLLKRVPRIHMWDGVLNLAGVVGAIANTASWLDKTYKQPVQIMKLASLMRDR